MGIGTEGTISFIGKFLMEKNLGIRIIRVYPEDLVIYNYDRQKKWFKIEEPHRNIQSNGQRGIR